MFSNATSVANPTQGKVRPMIELLTSANNNLIVVPAHRGVRALIFPVVTNFHKMARRPAAYLASKRSETLKGNCSVSFLGP